MSDQEKAQQPLALADATTLEIMQELQYRHTGSQKIAIACNCVELLSETDDNVQVRNGILVVGNSRLLEIAITNLQNSFQKSQYTKLVESLLGVTELGDTEKGI